MFIFAPLGTFKVNSGQIIQKLFSFITGKLNYIQNFYFIYLFTYFYTCIENMQADSQNVAYKEINISLKLEILIDWLSISYNDAWFPLWPVLRSHRLCFWTNRSFFSPPCFPHNYHPNSATNLWTGSNELSAHLEQSNVLTSQLNPLLAKRSSSMDQEASDSGQDKRRAEYFITPLWQYMRCYAKSKALHNSFTEYQIVLLPNGTICVLS